MTPAEHPAPHQPHPVTHAAYAASVRRPARTGDQPETGTTATASETATGPTPVPSPPGPNAVRTGREAHDGVAVGAVAVRVFRAARRRRLAMPADQRPRLTPGLIAELEARGWTIPDELRPQAAFGNAAGHGRAHRPRRRPPNNPGGECSLSTRVQRSPASPPARTLENSPDTEPAHQHPPHTGE